jgi:hypothetical protein
MFGSKSFLASVLLTTTSSAQFKKQSQQKIINAECYGTNAEQGAADLEKIFSEASEGGLPPDPEEIQELLLKA